jgi:putative SOS response-associated peptidase YedK
MPAILRREDEERWLDVSGAQFDKVRLVLKPFPSEQMGAHDVSTLVNKPENDTASVSDRFRAMRYLLRSCLFCEMP